VSDTQLPTILQIEKSKKIWKNLGAQGNKPTDIGYKNNYVNQPFYKIQ